MIGYKWTRPAIEVLCRVYPAGGWEAVSAELGIDSKRTIQRKAYAIGLKTTAAPPRGRPFNRGYDPRRYQEQSDQRSSVPLRAAQ